MERLWSRINVVAFLLTPLAIFQPSNHAYAASPWQNPALQQDVNGDGVITPADALMVTNAINAGGARALTSSDTTPPYLDVNGDGYLTSVDMLIVTNCLNNQECKNRVSVSSAPQPVVPQPKQAEGEGSPPPSTPPPTQPPPTQPPGRADCSLTDIDATLALDRNNCVPKLCPADPYDVTLVLNPHYNLIELCLQRRCCPTRATDGLSCSAEDALQHGGLVYECRMTTAPDGRQVEKCGCWDCQGTWIEVVGRKTGPLNAGETSARFSPEPATCEENLCPVYELKVTRHTPVGGGSVPLEEMYQPPLPPGHGASAAELAAFQSVVDCAENVVHAAADTCRGSDSGKITFDDCTVGAFMRIFLERSGLKDLYRAPLQPISLRDFLSKSESDNTGKSGLVRYDAKADTNYMYITPQCVIVPAVELENGVEMCDAGQLHWIQSPLALLWEDGVDVNAEPVSVNFPLNPAAQPGKWYAWKASAKAPLVVYDPEHRGRITSAAQLFGEWTFGGKRFAALHNAHTPPVSAADSRWRDGYEALGSLDANNDGKVSGAELEPLALWFDRNRNGISEQGEVQRLSDAGVTALYYQPDGKDSVSGNILASRGFERKIEGRTLRGASVDWYAWEADSQLELAALYGAQAAICAGSPAQPDAALAALPPSATPTSDRAAPKAVNGGITGVWKYYSPDPNIKGIIRPQGHLIIQELADGTIKGYSIAGVSFGQSRGKAHGVLNMVKLKGTSSYQAGKVSRIAFDITPPGTSISSTAWLSADGTAMTGESTASFTIKNAPVNFTYSWKAERVQLR